MGIKESDTGLVAPSQWDLVSDKQMMQEEQPLQVARCTKIISPNTEDAKYVINVKQIAKFVVGLGDKISPTDIKEGMRVGVDRNKYQIQIPLPPKIDPSVTMMTVEEKPDVTYNDAGGSMGTFFLTREASIGKLAHTLGIDVHLLAHAWPAFGTCWHMHWAADVALPMLHPEKFVKLGIDRPKGVLCYGPPGTSKTLLARAVANRTDACFIRVIGSELVQKYVGEGSRAVRELFQLEWGVGAKDEEGSWIALSLTITSTATLLKAPSIPPLGCQNRAAYYICSSTPFCHPHTPDLDRAKIQPPLYPCCCHSFNINPTCQYMGIWNRHQGADIRSVCTEAGMYAIQARRKTVTEKDFLDAVNKVIKWYQKFSATPKYMVYN
ncbi:regulatory particle triple-A 1A [Actinidia rufa]|uniref:Regulatory particle triple-A 1A n=1 Tax=Actinidia rufa TaxID=165716 RepID=A0A7J0GBK9_9ERIC|nr:regulatory particle triple-A 1A [Actinidia rufa]